MVKATTYKVSIKADGNILFIKELTADVIIYTADAEQAQVFSYHKDDMLSYIIRVITHTPFIIDYDGDEDNEDMDAIDAGLEGIFFHKAG